MDRQSIIGFVLIAIIITVWMVYNSSHTVPVPPAPAAARQTAPDAATAPPSTASLQSSAPAVASAPEKLVKVETDKYTAWISSKGMTIARFELKGFQSHSNTPVQLIKQGEHALGLTFTGNQGKPVDTRKLDATFIDLPYEPIVLTGTAAKTLRSRMDIGNGASIERTLTFTGNVYHIDAGFTLTNMDNAMPSTQRWFDISWERGLQYQEGNSVEESNGAIAYASMNGSLEELDAPKYNEPVSSHQSGKVDFIGTKTKYFSAALLNPNSNGEDTYYLDGVRYGAPDNGVVEEYSFSLRVPYRGGVQSSQYRLYLGPLDYDIVKEYGMASTVNFGWKWLVRPIGEFFMLPVFTTIYKFLPNFGVAIIVFSLLMKLLLYPLSMGQIQSAQKMKVLQPEVEKLRKKFADDPTGMQQAQMKLFGEYGINPMGGCLPLLLQMPILYALYSVLTSNIHMRHAMFVQGWIPDLSVPDHILTLPFSVLGVHALSGMALIMGITMFIQQRMTVTDPSQQAMVYMMPVMMTMMFSNLPSGLNLYYLTFNFLGIAQQVYMTKFSKSKITLEDLKRMPKKESWLQKRLQMAQEMAEAQGRMPQQQKRAPKRSKK
ncbi:MAG: hypothetical protein RL156_87 [Bacteroidota bacterium]